MKSLVVEDDFLCRKVMQRLICDFGDCDLASDGEEALQAYDMAWEDCAPYDTIFLDICIPKIDGLKVLKAIRRKEKKWDLEGRRTTNIIMTTALDDSKNVMHAYYECGASGYLTKPILRSHLEAELRKLKIDFSAS